MYREVRLAALNEAPYAFGSTFEREVGATERQWRQGLNDRTRFVAEAESEVVGTVSGGDASWTGAAAITAMWVDPRFRKQGIGDLLVKTVLEWAKTTGYVQMFLWVTDGNTAAERLYLGNGFTRTGDRQEVRPAEFEYEMGRKL